MSRSLAEIMLDDTVPQFASVAIPFGTSRNGLDGWVADNYQELFRARISPNVEVLYGDPDSTSAEQEEHITTSRIFYYNYDATEGYQENGKDQFLAYGKIFLSRNGEWLIQQFEALDPVTLRDNEFALFLEDNTGDALTSNLMLIKGGKAFLPKIIPDPNDPDETIIDTSGSEPVRLILNDVGVQARYAITAEMALRLMSTLNDTQSTWEIIAEWFTAVTDFVRDAPYLILEEFGGLVADWLTKTLRIDEKFWNSKFDDANAPSLEKDILAELDSYIALVDVLGDEYHFMYLPGWAVISELVKFQLKGLRYAVEQIISTIENAIAFITGFWNGLIDLIAGIFELIALASKVQMSTTDALQFMVTKNEFVAEFADSALQAMQKINWWVVMERVNERYIQLQVYLNYVLPLRIMNKLAGLNATEWAYYLGYAVFEIVQLLIPELEIAKIARLGKLKKLDTFTEFFSDNAAGRMGRNIEKRIATPKQAADDMMKFGVELTDTLGKGTDEVTRAVDEVFDGVKNTVDDMLGLKNADEIPKRLPEETPTTKIDDAVRLREELSRKKKIIDDVESGEIDLREGR
ncbi:MAG: hypothetical protein ACKVOR_01675, partial [Flavobacteriales bacterium]